MRNVINSTFFFSPSEASPAWRYQGHQMDVSCANRMAPPACRTRIQSCKMVDMGNFSKHRVLEASRSLRKSRTFGCVFRTCDRAQIRGIRHVAQTVQEDEAVGMDVGGDETFDWNKAWYPVQLLDDLEPKKPTAVELLGTQFVLWRDKNEEWRCFRNMCPHRLARLSEGRIEPSDGTLVCSYHGWRFDEKGACKLIPQQEGLPKGAMSPRSSVMSFPVKVQEKVVWIWPDESESAFIDSAMVEPHGMEYNNEEFVVLAPMFTRDLPYPVDVLLENIIDPSHLCYAHHGVQGNRDKVGWMRAKLREPENKSEIKVTFESLTNADAPVEKQTVFTRNLEFCPPNYIHYGFLPEGQTETNGHMQTYAIPTSASCSKIFSRFVVRKAAFPWFLRLIVKLSKPTWAKHMYANELLEGDTVFLTEQGNTLRSSAAAGKPWGSQYYTPTSADLGVITLRRWLHSGAGGGGPKLPDGQPLLQKDFAVRSREDLLERYESHTKQCKVCSNGLWWVRFWKVVAQASSCTVAAWGLLAVKQTQAGVVESIASNWGLLASATAAALVAYGLFNVESAFIFKDYEQWKR